MLRKNRVQFYLLIIFAAVIILSIRLSVAALIEHPEQKIRLESLWFFLFLISLREFIRWKKGLPLRKALAEHLMFCGGYLFLLIALPRLIVVPLQNYKYEKAINGQALVSMKIVDKMGVDAFFIGDPMMSYYVKVVPVDKPDAAPAEVNFRTFRRDIEKDQVRDFIQQEDRYVWLEPLSPELPRILNEGLLFGLSGILIFGLGWLLNRKVLT